MRCSAHRFSWCLLILTVAVTGCEVSSHGPRDREKNESPGAMMPAARADSIARLIRDATTAAFATGPGAATGIPALYAPDAVLSDASNETHAGHAAITRAYTEGMPPGASIEIASAGAIGSGDLVVDMGTYTFRMPNPAGGPPIEVPGRYLGAIQRMDDGSWKVVRMVENPIGPGADAQIAAAAWSDSSAPAVNEPAPAPSGFDDGQ